MCPGLTIKVETDVELIDKKPEAINIGFNKPTTTKPFCNSTSFAH